MNRGVRQDELSATIASAIWEGKAIIIGTDGLVVQDPLATYLLIYDINLPNRGQAKQMSKVADSSSSLQLLSTWTHIRNIRKRRHY
jgi:hypothetical protein